MLPGLPPGGLTPEEAAFELLLRRAARKNFIDFVTYTKPDYLVADFHIQICNALDAVLKGEIKKLAIEAPPRHGKSELVSRRFPAYCLGHHPYWQLMSTSYNTRLAAAFGRFNRNLVTGQQYQLLFENTRIAADSRANDLWHTTEGGVYLATGVDAGQTGWGANIYIFDDLLRGVRDADSESTKKAIWDWYLGEALTRAMPDFAQVMMATRWATDDPTGRALADGGWVRLTYPAIYNEDTDEERALHPARYPLERLREIKATMTSGGRLRLWKALYQQEPTVESGDYIKREWFTHRYSAVPAPLNIYIASDYAVTEPEEGEDPDWTEHGVFGITIHGELVVLDWWSGRTTSDVWVEALIGLIRKWNPICVYGEAGPIRRAVEPWMMRRFREEHVNVWVEWLASTRDKATRGRPFQAMAARKKIMFGRQTFAEEVIDQCVLFPGARYKDKFDTMSLMCQAIHISHPAIADPENISLDQMSDYGEGEWEDYDDDWRTV